MAENGMICRRKLKQLGITFFRATLFTANLTTWLKMRLYGEKSVSNHPSYATASVLLHKIIYYCAPSPLNIMSI
jgi:hypothetical protein